MTDRFGFPLVLQPRFESGAGGNHLLRAYLGDLPPPLPSGTVAAWYVLDAPGQSTCVAGGPFADHTLTELTQHWGAELVGRRHRPGQPFPVCLRLVQNNRQEPLQVHPERAGADYPGNTRFWYTLAADPEGVVISGIAPTANLMTFTAQLNTPQLRQCLQVYHPERHDAFLAPIGRVHALGAGVLVLELQERLATALPVSGWGAADAVPLDAAHAALEHVLFSDRQVRRISRDAGPIRQTRKVPLLPQCPAFHVDEIRLCDRIAARTTGASFHLYAVVAGEVQVQHRQQTYDLRAGQVVLIPATAGDYCITTRAPQARLLKAGLPE